MFGLQGRQSPDEPATAGGPELGESAPVARDPWADLPSETQFLTEGGAPRASIDADAMPTNEQYVELVGTQLRASGFVDIGRFRRVTDYVDLLDGFFALRDTVFLTRTGEPSRITMDEFRVRLDEVAIVGQHVAEDMSQTNELGVHVEKVTQRLIVTTAAHIIYGLVHTLPGVSVLHFVDSGGTKFLPMTQVRVRWLGDRRLAARYSFALVQRTLILGVATEGTGAPRELQARRQAVRDEALRQARAELRMADALRDDEEGPATA
jgi:hypothetical protein